VLFRSDKKTNLKRHLQNNHSSQLTAPLLLSNDALMVHPNTRFQCGLCRRYHVNMNDFVKHMTEKHKMQVLIIDSNNEGCSSVQEQLRTHGRAELICTSNANSEANIKLSDSNQIVYNEYTNQVIIIEEEKQNAIKVPAHSHHYQHQHQQHHQQQPTTVRINPAVNDLLMKRNKPAVQRNFLSLEERHMQQSQMKEMKMNEAAHVHLHDDATFSQSFSLPLNDSDEAIEAVNQLSADVNEIRQQDELQHHAFDHHNHHHQHYRSVMSSDEHQHHQIIEDAKMIQMMH